MAETAPTTDKSKSSLKPIIIGGGRRTSDDIEQLMSGEGELLQDILEAVRELQDSGEIKAGAQPVVVVVKERRIAENILSF